MRRFAPCLLSFALLQPASGAPAGKQASPADQKHPPHAVLARLPLSFEPNLGQAPAGTRFLAHVGAMEFGVAPDRLSMALPSPTGDQKLTMRLPGADAHASSQATEKGPGQANYLLGDHSGGWFRHIPEFGRVTFQSVYPGIDLSFYGNGSRLEHDFIVHPGARLNRIRMNYEGGGRLTLDGAGELHIQLSDGELVSHAPQVYQVRNGVREYKPGRYILHGDREVTFAVEKADPHLDLVIDPVLDYATYLANMSLDVSGVATDSQGNTYIVGETFSASYPITPGAVQPTCNSCQSTGDIFITKLNAAGTAQLYSTYLGGSNGDQPNAIAVDKNGNAAITGFTLSSDFPLKNAIASGTPTGYDGFVASLSPDGSALNFSSRLGGTSASRPGSSTYAQSVTTDTNGNVYVSGTTESPYLPVSTGALNAGTPSYTNPYIFLLKLGLDGSVGFGALLGNPGQASGGVGTAGLAVDSTGAIYMAGTVGSAAFNSSTSWPTTSGAYQTSLIGTNPNAPFAAKIAADGSSFLYSSLVGSGKTSSMAVGSDGEMLLTGSPGSGFPVTSNAYSSTAGSSFITRLSADATKLQYSTYLGSTNSPGRPLTGIALDSSGNVWVAGPGQDGLPLVDPVEASPGAPPTGYGYTSIVAEFDPGLQNVLFSTYLNGPSGGTSINGLALDPQNRVHLAGTANDDFPTTAGVFLAAVTPPPPNYFYTYGFAAVMDPGVASPAICISNNQSAFAQLGSSGSGSFTVTNCGTAPLTISSVQLQSATLSLPAPSACVTTLAPGATCSVAFNFTPAVAGATTATVVINSNAAIATDSVTISGFGTAPTLSLPSSVLSFSPQVLGVPGSGSTATISVLNVGFAPLNIDLTRTAVSGPFSIVSTSCNGPIQPATSNVPSGCQFKLAYQPTAVGTDSGQLTIFSNDPQHPQVMVSLSGTAVAAYTTPTVTQLSPSALPLNSTTTSMIVNGSHFFPTSYVTLDGEPLPTVFSSENTLQVTLDPSLFSVVGELPLVVVNPAPGGASSSVAFTIYRSVPLSAASLLYDPAAKLLFASIPSIASSNPNTVLSIDPLTGALGTPIPVGNNPGKLAISGDGSYLFVGLDGDHTLQRINLATNAVDRTFPLPPDPSVGPTTVQDMHAVPGSQQNVVVSLYRRASPGEAGTALFTDAGLAAFIPNDPQHAAYSVDSFAFTSDPSTFYGYPFVGNFFNTTAVGVNTLTVISNGQFGGCCNQTTGSLVTSDGNLLYTNSGEVWDPKTQKVLGTFVTPTGSQLFYEASVVASASDARVYMLDTGNAGGVSGGDTILGYDPSSYKLTGEVTIPPGTLPAATDLARWGNDGFAFRSYDYSNYSHANDAVLLIRSSVAQTATGGTPSVSTLSPTAAASGSANFVLTLNGAGFIPGSVVLWNGTARQTTFNSATQLTSLIPSSDLSIAGSAQITVVNPGGSTSAAQSFTITGTTPAISFAIPDQSFGAAPFTISATSNSSGTLSYAVVSGPASLNGSTLTLTGVGAVVLRVNQAAAGGFSAGQATATFTVAQAAPQVTWPKPAPLTYGAVLSATQLNATASVPGTFTYTPAAGTVLPAGSQTLSVAFTPTNTVGETTVTATTTLTVAPASLTVTAVSTSRAYGAANPTLAGTLAGTVNGDVLTASASTTATASSAVGTYPITPSVTGANIGNYTVTAVNGNLTVTQAATATTLSSSASSSPTGASLTFTAKVTSATSGTPTGTVQFLENGSTALGSAQLSGGSATFSTSALAAGTQTITAVYAGDTNFKGSQSSASTQSIVVPDFSVTATPSSLTIQRGQSGTAVFTVTPVNGFNQPVSLSCGTLPPSVTCTFAPSSLTPNGGPVTSTLTVTTTAPTVSALHVPSGGTPRQSEHKPLVAFAIACCLLPLSRRRRFRRSLFLVPSLALVAVSLISGCGGSSPQTTLTGGTPLGPSQVAVVVSTSSGSGATQHAANLTITVTN